MARRRMTKQERTRQIYLRVCFVCALVAVLFTVLYVFLNDASKTTIDLKDVTHITLTGFDGEGVLTATVDVDEKYGAFYETVSVDFSGKRHALYGKRPCCCNACKRERPL